jgi:hypothetical protein
MKTNIVESKTDYPCIKIQKLTNGRIIVVLFSEPFTGTCIHSSDSSYVVGHFWREWSESCFSPLPFGTKITMEN